MSENVTRRSVLEKGAFVSGATLLGGAAIAGSSMAQEGNSSHASTNATVMKSNVLTLGGSVQSVPCVAQNDPVAGFRILAINGDPVSEKDIQFENTARFEKKDQVKVVHTFGECPEDSSRIGVNVVEA